jgi:hypothetical protein
MTPTTLDEPSLASHQAEKLRLLWEVLEHGPGLGNLEMAEMYLLRLRQEGISEVRGIVAIAEDFAQAKATKERVHTEFGGRDRGAGADAPSVEDLALVKELANEVGGLATLAAKVRDLEAVAGRVGGWERLRASLETWERLLGQDAAGGVSQ